VRNSPGICSFDFDRTIILLSGYSIQSRDDDNDNDNNMPLEDMHSQHRIWDAHHNTNDLHTSNPFALPTPYRIGIFVVFVIISFTCLGYIFWIVVEKERKEQKIK
jgi:hypothetical protein